ncbi:MAG: RNA polymerase factor sigma-54 [Oscillospiraceae bacterium]|nr:RNA polymerase factor sigma-54 [Oscillospiraceae bacterium]
MAGISQQQVQRQELQQYQILQLNVLSMTGDELSAYLDSAQEENPLIDLIRDRKQYEQDLSVGRWLRGSEGTYERPEYSAADDDFTVPEIPCGDEETLEQHLRMQIDFDRLRPALRAAVSYLIGNLDEDGRLRLTLPEIAAACRCDAACAQQALTMLQSLEPFGIGARDLSECLMLQLKALSPRCVAAEMIAGGCLGAVATSSAAGIAAKCGLSLPETEQALALIRTLDPRPGAAYTQESAPCVIPDLQATPLADGTWKLELNDNWVGTIGISRYYTALLRAAGDAEASAYLANRIGHAKLIMAAVEHRRETMLEIARMILEIQSDFFTAGGALRPLSLDQIADHVGCHKSTVSRAIRGKYLSWPGGCIALRRMIVSAVGVSAQTQSSVLDQIRSLLASEDAHHPLSDQAIADALAQGGTQVARRTVVKYRELLGIANARARRQ